MLVIASDVFAQSIPATPSGTAGWKAAGGTPAFGTTAYPEAASTACASVVGSGGTVLSYTPENAPGLSYPQSMALSVQCLYKDNSTQTNHYSYASITSTWEYYTCPSGYTLNGTMCDPQAPCPMFGTPEGDTATVQPPAGCTCPALHEWVPANGCRKKCQSASAGQSANGGWPFVFPKGQLELCHQGCLVQQAVGEYYEFDDGSRQVKATETGWACQTSNETPKPNVPPAPAQPKEPPCGPTEGVLTSSSGTVSCIPEGTPSPRKPQVEEKKKKEVFPDGSVKETNTKKTTDPKTGASHTHTTTSSTGGMAGPAGTGTSTETDGKATDAGDGTGGDGECESGDCDGDAKKFAGPDLDGIYQCKAKTYDEVMTEFETAIGDKQTLPGAVLAFFNIGSVAGSCGGMQIDVPFIDVHINLDDFFCTATADMLMTIIGNVLVVLAALYAFRIGVSG